MTRAAVRAVRLHSRPVETVNSSSQSLEDCFQRSSVREEDLSCERACHRPRGGGRGQRAGPGQSPAGRLPAHLRHREGLHHKAAEKMPEANYAFKPTKDVRSFGQLIGHIADASCSCSAVTGDKPPMGGFDGPIEKAPRPRPISRRRWRPRSPIATRSTRARATTPRP